MTWQKHQFGSLGTGSKISAPRSEVGNSTSFIPGDSQPLAQFGSKMILTNRGRLDRQASEPGDQNMGWKAEEGKDLEQKRGKWYSDKDRAKGNEAEVKEREWTDYLWNFDAKTDSVAAVNRFIWEFSKDNES